jgi:predicted transposase YdaD
MNYEESLKDFRDMYSVMKTQLEKGRKEGREEGIAIGVEKGREEGIAIATLANAKALIEQGIPKDAVQKALSLTDEQMKEL